MRGDSAQILLGLAVLLGLTVGLMALGIRCARALVSAHARRLAREQREDVDAGRALPYGRELTPEELESVAESRLVNPNHELEMAEGLEPMRAAAPARRTRVRSRSLMRQRPVLRFDSVQAAIGSVVTVGSVVLAVVAAVVLGWHLVPLLTPLVAAAVWIGQRIVATAQRHSVDYYAQYSDGNGPAERPGPRA